MTIQTRNRKKIETNILYEGDCLEVMKSLPDKSIDCILTSPPYWNTFWEKYSTDPAMVSIEPDITSYLSHLVSICKECYRVLRDTGVFWVLIGEPNLRNGKRRSNLSGIPWKLAFPSRISDGYSDQIRSRNCILIPQNTILKRQNLT